MRTIVFLHIPKTAGQAIHHELVRAVGKANVSPIRVHSEVPQGTSNLPPGYLLHSGHIDWTDLETLPEDRFVFTVLRDPYERIASFYFYLLKEAKLLSPEELATPQQTGKRMILENNADDYFFGGDSQWHNFVLDHYDNFYCSYFATRMMRGRRRIKALTSQQRLERALAGIRGIDRVYHIDDLAALEDDAAQELGIRIRVAGNYVNTGPHQPEDRRWPKLAALFERSSNLERLNNFVMRDVLLMRELGMEVVEPA